MTDSNSTLDDEAAPGPRQHCYFWDPFIGKCHFELLIPDGEPCATCPAASTPSPETRRP